MVFWLNDPTILMNSAHIRELWPTADMSDDDRLNSITRFVVLASVLGFAATKQYRFIAVGQTTVLGIAMYGAPPAKEGFVEPKRAASVTPPTVKNPFMNVMMQEYSDKPLRKEAELAYTPTTSDLIKQKVKARLDPRLFKGVNDEINFDMSMRNFFTTANTTIPNDQEGFGRFCYGGMKSAKEGDEDALMRNNPRLGSVIN